MEEKKSKNELISILLVYFIASTLFIISNLFFKIAIWDKFETPIHSYIFSVFFGIVIYSLIMALTKKSSRATIICYIFIFIIGIINEIKIVYTLEPLYFSDIHFLTNIFDLMKLATPDQVSGYTLKFLVLAALMAFILELIVLLNSKYNVEIKNIKVRLIIIIIDIIILILLFFPTNYTKGLYLKIFFNTDEYLDFKSYTTNLSFYKSNGLINGMYGVFLNSKFIEPENYDENSLNEMLNNTGELDTEKFGTPNIIVVFSEAFWDVDILTEVEFDKPVTSNFNTLKNEGEFVNLISPSYGGMSENVAFELLTGGSMNYFPKGYIPIMSLYSRKNSSNIPSIVKVLNKNGYNSEIVFGKDYYNSEKAYLNMGFNNYSELTESGQSRVSDKYCTDVIIKRLEQKSEQPLFYVLETIESHMPFSKNKYTNYDISITKSELKQSMNDGLRSYAQGIYNADQQLGRLYNYIQSYDEPTILLFLGDHLPYLYTVENENVIFKLDYFNTDDTILNDYRKYNTQALVLSNFEMENLDIPDYMGVDLLLNYLVNQLDIENEEYYKWLYNTTDILSGANRYISFDKNGKLYNTKELTGEMKQIYEDRELMQYKFFINSK